MQVVVYLNLFLLAMNHLDHPFSQMKLKSFSLFIPFFILFLFSCEKQDEQIIRVATTSSMQAPVREIAIAFEKSFGFKTEIILGSSGKLTSQILNGAPYDVFISADLFYPQKILQKNADYREIKIYGIGQLVMWTMNENLDLEQDASQLFANKTIAIANPKVAPFGQKAKEYFQTLGLWDKLSPAMILGENVNQVNQFVTLETVDIGFTALSAVLYPDLAKKGNWKSVSPEKIGALKQGAVLLSNDDEARGSAFFNFLSSQESKTIFKNYGFKIPD